MTPISLFYSRRRLWVDWCHLRTYRFDEAFFDQTVFRALKTGRRPLIRTGFDALLEHQSTSPTRLAAILFHLPRSGSTLLTRLLSCVQGVFCLREPQIINQLLLIRASAIDASLRIRALRNVCQQLAAVRAGDDRHVLLKTSSWNVHAVPLFNAAFPASQKLWLQRQPAPVMQSLLERPPPWLQSDRLFRQIGTAMHGHASRGTRLTQRIPACLSAMLDAAGQAQLTVLDFDDLYEAMPWMTASVIGTTLDARTRRAMDEMTVYDAKAATRTRFRRRQVAPSSATQVNAIQMRQLHTQYRLLRKRRSIQQP